MTPEKLILDAALDAVAVDLRAGADLLAAAFVEDQHPRDHTGRWISGEGVSDGDVADESIAWAKNEYPKTALTEVKRTGLEPRDELYKGEVDGLRVRTDVPNTGSISATFSDSNEYDELPGIREVKLADLNISNYKATDDNQRVSRLADAIKESGEISPLIVVIDGTKKPYVLEGGHRSVALSKLGKKVAPAVVIVDHTKQRFLTVAGGKGSGNFGHKGRKGEVGGSDSDIVVGLVDSRGSVRSAKISVESSDRHNELFANHGRPASQRFTFHQGEVRWNEEPSAEDYFSVDDHLAREGLKVKEHRTYDRYSSNGFRIIKPPRPTLLSERSLDEKIDLALSLVGRSYSEVESALRAAGFDPSQARDESGKWTSDGAIVDRHVYHGGTNEHSAVVTYYTENKDMANSYVTMSNDRFGTGGSLHESKITIKNPAPSDVIQREAEKLGIDNKFYTPASVFDQELHGEHEVKELVRRLRKLGYDGATGLTDIAYGKNIEDKAHIVFKSLEHLDWQNLGDDRSLGDHKFSSTQINIPDPLRTAILSFPIKDEDLVERELDPHITVKYGLSPGVTASDVAEVCRSFGPIRVVLGEVGVFAASPTAAEEVGHPFHGNQWTEGITTREIADGGIEVKLPGFYKGSLILQTQEIPGGVKLPKDFASVSSVSVDEKGKGNAFRLYKTALDYLQNRGFEGIASERGLRNDASDKLWQSFKKHGARVDTVKVNNITFDLLRHLSDVVMRSATEGRWASAADALEFTSRYDAFGGMPNPKTMCQGQCEGTGWIPVYLAEGDTDRSVYPADETDPELIDQWYDAQRESPSDDGWHFVRCPACGGTGLRGLMRRLLSLGRGIDESVIRQRLRAAEFQAGHLATKSVGQDSVARNAAQGENDVVIIKVISPDLIALNKLISDLPHTDTHPDYHPHITLAYVTLGSGAYYEGLTLFAGQELNITEIVFCDTDGGQSVVLLMPEALAEFDESKHPRDEQGRWVSGGGVKALKKLAAGKQFISINEKNQIFDHLTTKEHAEFLKDYKKIPDLLRDARKSNDAEKTLSISKPRITSTQKSIEVSQVSELIEDPSLADTSEDGPPLLVTWHGKILVGDGHHRIAAALLRGEQRMKVEYVNLDKSLKTASYDESKHPRDHGKWTSSGVSRAERALATYKPSTRAKQLKAAASEKTIATTLGGKDLPDNEPMDVIVKLGGRTHGVEVKTLIDNSNDKLTMHPASRVRKEEWVKANKATGHTVVVDKRGSTPVYYHRSGFGAFRLAGMERVSLKDLKKRIMN